jgi:hypothetical protein
MDTEKVFGVVWELRNVGQMPPPVDQKISRLAIGPLAASQNKEGLGRNRTIRRLGGAYSPGRMWWPASPPGTSRTTTALCSDHSGPDVSSAINPPGRRSFQRRRPGRRSIGENGISHASSIRRQPDPATAWPPPDHRPPEARSTSGQDSRRRAPFVHVQRHPHAHQSDPSTLSR